MPIPKALHADGSKGTRKIIVVMTTGTHVSSKHIKDDYKSGPSPIWRGDDGRLAIHSATPAAVQP